MITILFARDVLAKDLIYSLCLVEEQLNVAVDRRTLRMVTAGVKEYIAVDADCSDIDMDDMAYLDVILPTRIKGYLKNEEVDA